MVTSGENTMWVFYAALYVEPFEFSANRFPSLIISGKIGVRLAAGNKNFAESDMTTSVERQSSNDIALSGICDKKR